MPEFVLPPPLQRGDAIGVIAPSSGGARDAPQVFELGLQRLEEVFDLRPRVHPTARQSNEFLATHPKARAAAIHEFFRDPEVKGIVATIGGNDQLRVLPHLDTGVLRNNPTRFYGMSDNTSLNLTLWSLGIISFNGAQLMNEIAVPGALPAYTERYCRKAFFEDSLGRLEPSEEWSDDPASWADREGVGEVQTFRENEGWTWSGADEPIEGRIWGGSSAIVQWHLAADRTVPAPSRLDGTVFVMETAEDLPSPSQVRARLMCLGERGLLGRFSAVLVGRPPGRSFLETRPPAAREEYRTAVTQTVRIQVSRYNPGAPVVTGLDWGHTTPIAPLPIGGRVRIDPEEREIRFPGPSTSPAKD